MSADSYSGPSSLRACKVALSSFSSSESRASMAQRYGANKPGTVGLALLEVGGAPGRPSVEMAHPSMVTTSLLTPRAVAHGPPGRGRPRPGGDRAQPAGTRSGEVIVAVGMCVVSRRASSQYSKAGTSRPITQEMSAPPSGSTSGPV